MTESFGNFLMIIYVHEIGGHPQDVPPFLVFAARNICAE